MGVIFTALVFLVVIPSVKSSSGSEEGGSTKTLATQKPNRSLKNAVTPTEVAAIVGKTLEPVLQKQHSSESTGLTLYDRVLRAEQLAQQGGDFGQVAHDYAVALRFADARMQNSPNGGDLLQGGIDMWQGSKEDDSLQLFGGLWSAANEIDKINEYTKEMEQAHVKIIECRKKVISALKSGKPSSSSAKLAETYFQQSGYLTSFFPDDTLVLKNKTRKTIHHVMVTVRLIGMNGDTFDNLYYADQWKSGEQLKAICRSDRPFRETVHQVSRVRYQIFADEVVGKPQVLIGNPILHMMPPDYGKLGG